jgi:hypothetical protein
MTRAIDGLARLRVARRRVVGARWRSTAASTSE